MTTHVDILKYEIKKLEAERDAFKMAADEAIKQRDEARAALDELQGEVANDAVSFGNDFQDWEDERDELRRLLRAALAQNKGWYSDEAKEAVALLAGDDGTQ